MKKIILFGCIFSLAIVIFSSFPSVVSYKTSIIQREEKLFDTIHRKTETIQAMTHRYQQQRKNLNSQLFDTIQISKKLAEKGIIGNILVTYLVRFMLLGSALWVLYQYYWMAEDATPFSIQWFLTLPFLILAFIFGFLVYLAMGIVMLPILIVVLMFLEDL
jgi:hypothetical protein